MTGVIVWLAGVILIGVPFVVLCWIVEVLEDGK